jgi:hypothetical protein
MAPDGRKPVPVPGRPLVTVLVHDPALLTTANGWTRQPLRSYARLHALVRAQPEDIRGLMTTQRKAPRPVSLTLANRTPWRTQLHAYSEHRIRRYAPGATPILSCECPLYNRRYGVTLRRKSDHAP